MSDDMVLIADLSLSKVRQHQPIRWIKRATNPGWETHILQWFDKDNGEWLDVEYEEEQKQ